MNSYRLMPRLTAEKARGLREGMLDDRSSPEFDRVALEEALSAPGVFPATGGRPATSEDMLDLRSRILHALESGPQDHGSHADVVIGRELFRASEGSRAEFGNPQVWDFLALVLLPDVVARRIQLSRSRSSRVAVKARLTGGNRRHVLQRLWLRWAVLGPEIVESMRVSEDLYAAFLERPSLAQSPDLARIAVEKMLMAESLDLEARLFYREFVKRLRAMTGVVALLMADEEYLRLVIDHVYHETLLALERKTPKPEGVEIAVDQLASPVSEAPVAPSTAGVKRTGRRRPMSLRRLVGGG